MITDNMIELSNEMRLRLAVRVESEQNKRTQLQVENKHTHHRSHINLWETQNPVRWKRSTAGLQRRDCRTWHWLVDVIHVAPIPKHYPKIQEILQLRIAILHLRWFIIFIYVVMIQAKFWWWLAFKWMKNAKNYYVYTFLHTHLQLQRLAT